ncbi:hypothetical protein AMQ83_14465, partial [Paenibacillus riograndensis]
PLLEPAGYASKTGTLGVAFVTARPEPTNLFTAAAHANSNNLPLLFIPGHQSIKELGIPQCQDSSAYLADLADMFRPATLYSKLVERGDHFGTIFNHAISIALSGPRGPVHLCIPFDLPVSYNHLPLPTRDLVYISVAHVSLNNTSICPHCAQDTSLTYR